MDHSIDVPQSTIELINRLRRMADEMRASANATRELIATSYEALRAKPAPQQASRPTDHSTRFP